MFLKEIGIKGFKSFANKIKMNITPGITVIVGPNGCGKSNIIDAIRWILGEQSIRSLRGAKATDMIFAGNQEHKARNFAEAYMLFGNAERKLSIDSEEVEIKRIVYRSGEIENYINGIPCKLRDIQELFLGSGLGKNSYSIIAQGKVDFVLNARPSERRILFEEASDISIYRNRKERSLKKLGVIENNILRVNDILHEVETTLSHFKKKSDDLETYQYYHDQILKLQFYLICLQHKSLQGSIIKNNKKITILKDDIAKIDRVVFDYKNEIFKTEQKKIQLENQLEEYLKQSLENEINKNNFINQLKINKQQKIDTERIILNSKKDKEKTEEQYKKFSSHLSSIEEDIFKTEENENNYRKNLKEKKFSLEKYSYINVCYKERLLTVESISKDTETCYNNYRKILIAKQEELQAKNISFSEREIEIKHLMKRVNANNKLEKNLNLELSQTEQSIKQLIEEEKEKNTELTKVGALIEKKNALVQKYSNNIELKNKEIILLKELLNTIKDWDKKTEYSDIVFEEKALKDIICFCELKNVISKIPDNLKEIFNFILDDGLKYLHLAHSDKIHTLKQNYKIQNTPKLKVVANNLISPSNNNLNSLIAEMVLKNKKIIGFANKLVSVPPEFKNLIDAVMGNILIVEDMETALTIAKQNKDCLTIISLDGIIVNERGIVTIGHFLCTIEKNRHEISQARVLALEKEINFFDNELQKKQSILEDKKKKFNSLNHEVRNINKKMDVYLTKNNEKKIQLTNIKHNILVSENLLKSLHERQNLKTKKIENVKGIIRLINKDIADGIILLDSISLCNNYLHRYMEHSSLLINELKRNIETFEMKISWSNERKGLLQKRKREMEEFVNNYHQEEKDREKKLDDHAKNHCQLLQQGIELKEKLDSCQKREDKLIGNINKTKESLKEKDYTLRKIREKIELEQECLNNKKNDLHDCEMIHIQNKEKLNHLLQTLNNQYNTTIEEILPHKHYAKNQAKALTKITEYKDKIKAMGQINYNAPLEYQEQLNKFKELQYKKEEIVQSKEKLLALIDETDRIARDHFHNTFKEVEINFKEIFKKLFHGGQVALEFTDNKKLLETGIEVLVQPPGKQVQNISLLSSGEKALTAIALLFALWKSNPTPFCFFDEIDSALDELNAIRLSSFIKNDDLKNSQIIMITHQKEVMKRADVLYGITMDGYGTSKLMSIKMLDTGGEQKSAI